MIHSENSYKEESFKKDTTMSIPVKGIEPAENKLSNKNGFVPGGKNVRPKDRRINKHDRRESVRNGIFVSFSFKNDRRVLRDRRSVHNNGVS